MTNKNTKTNEHIESALENSTEKNQPSDDFRETLLKSGLDISAFQFETKDTNPAADINPPLNPEKIDLEKEKTAKISLLSIENQKDALPKLKRQHFMAIVGIIAIIVLQSAFQFSFVQEENLQSAENLIKNNAPAEKNIEKAAEIKVPEIPEIKEAAKIEAKTENKKPEKEVLAATKRNAPKIQREIRQTPARPVLPKKEPRNPAAARLRRAEKILTGV